MIQDGSRQWATVIEGISATGRRLPPFVIFKGKVITTTFLDAWRSDYGGQVTVSENGWTNNAIGLQWFQEIFEPSTRATMKGRKRLLLLDGHDSHISHKVIQLALENDIILLCLPPHTTHMLQPLDVDIFSPLATVYKSKLEAYCRFAGDGQNIGKPEFLDLFMVAREEAIDAKNISSAWADAGLIPLNPSVVFDLIPKNDPQEDLQDKSAPSTPSKLLLATSTGLSIAIGVTPKNAKEVDNIVAAIQTIQDDKSDGKNQDLLLFLAKAAKSAIANAALQKLTNEEIIRSQQRAAQRKNRRCGNVGGKLLDNDVLATIKKENTTKAEQQAEKEFCAAAKKAFKDIDLSLFAFTTFKEKLAAAAAARKLGKDMEALGKDNDAACVAVLQDVDPELLTWGLYDEADLPPIPVVRETPAPSRLVTSLPTHTTGPRKRTGRVQAPMTPLPTIPETPPTRISTHGRVTLPYDRYA